MRLDMYMCNRDLDALAMLEHANDETIRLVMRSLISTALFAMPCFDASLFAYPLLGNRCTSVCTIAILLEHYIGVHFARDIREQLRPDGAETVRWTHCTAAR